MSAAAILPELSLPPRAARRADDLCFSLQKRGYTPEQIGLLLRAVATHEPTQLQRTRL